MYRVSLLLSVLWACGDSRICDSCDAAEGLVWCTDCPTTESCISTIEHEETGEIVFECESDIGESCIGETLAASCPDV